MGHEPTGFPAPTFSIGSGVLPPGLSLDPATGVLSGTATTPGSYTFTVTADNGIGTAASSDPITLTVRPALAITTGSLPNGTVGIAYTATLTTSGGDGAPDVWSLATGSRLPDGLTLSADGVITGTPTTDGITNFTVSVNDPVVARFSITIVPAPVVQPNSPGTTTTQLPQTGWSIDPIASTELALLLMLAGMLMLALARHTRRS